MIKKAEIASYGMLMERLPDEGNTVVAIEHNRQFRANCDYVIELGPGAGKDGGRVIRQGRTDE